jgi:hypothetical protein
MLVVLDEIVVDLSCLCRSFAGSFFYGYILPPVVVSALTFTSCCEMVAAVPSPVRGQIPSRQTAGAKKFHHHNILLLLVIFNTRVVVCDA